MTNEIPSPKGWRKNNFPFSTADASRPAALFVAQIPTGILAPHALPDGRLDARNPGIYSCVSPNRQIVAIIGSSSEISREIRWYLEAVGYAVLALENHARIMEEVIRQPIALIVFGDGVLNENLDSQLVGRLKSYPFSAGIPLVKVRPGADPQDATDLPNLGFDDILTEDFQPKFFLNKIGELIGKAHRRRMSGAVNS